VASGAGSHSSITLPRDDRHSPSTVGPSRDVR
jgi:hypothetical protein